jgi:hypothetical protein
MDIVDWWMSETTRMMQNALNFSLFAATWMSPTLSGVDEVVAVLDKHMDRLGAFGKDLGDAYRASGFNLAPRERAQWMKRFEALHEDHRRAMQTFKQLWTQYAKTKGAPMPRTNPFDPAYR